MYLKQGFENVFKELKKACIICTLLIFVFNCFTYYLFYVNYYYFVQFRRRAQSRQRIANQLIFFRFYRNTAVFNLQISQYLLQHTVKQFWFHGGTLLDSPPYMKHSSYLFQENTGSTIVVYDFYYSYNFMWDSLVSSDL